MPSIDHSMRGVARCMSAAYASASAGATAAMEATVAPMSRANRMIWPSRATATANGSIST